MWGVKVTDELNDWTTLRQKIAKHGLRNSLLIAPMPTASTAQILGNNESIEPYTSNIYTRRVLSGDFQVCALQNEPHRMICGVIHFLSVQKTPKQVLCPLSLHN